MKTILRRGLSRFFFGNPKAPKNANELRSLAATQSSSLESLEPRQMMALLGVSLNQLPIEFYNSSGQLRYEAATETFDVSATPNAILTTSGPRLINATHGDFQIHARINNAGQFVRGVNAGDSTVIGNVNADGDDVVLRGSTDINGDGSIDPLTESGILLKGELIDIGWLDSGGPTDQYDFKFIVTGGLLASQYIPRDGGIILTSEASNFSGSFASDISGQAKGSVGPINGPQPSSISGFVYHDQNDDGIFQGSENPIPGTLITLTGTNDAGQSITRTATTDSNGFYIFNDLRPGTYALTETQPGAYLDGKDTIGTPGGSTANDQFSNILLPAGFDGVQNNFGELLPSSISGYVYYDQNNDGIFQNTESPIPGTEITLTGTDSLGNAVSLTAFTDSNGFYIFSGLRGGSYTITESQPAAYLDGKDTIGTPGGSTANDVFTNIILPYNFDGVQNNFGEILVSSISGYVYYDQNNDGTFQNTESPISGTIITLTGTDDLGNSVNQSAVTDGNGFYFFGGLRPGTYALTETQPAAYLDGKDTIGTPGGSTANDQFSNILLPAGFDGVQNNFGEILASSISGYVYYDRNNDGTFQNTESPISGTTITLTGTDDLGNSVNQVGTTDGNGFYFFGNLRPGTYALTETQPAAYLDGKDTIGTPGGSTTNDQFSNILLPAGFDGVQNNFGEILASIDIEKFVNATVDPIAGGEGLTPGYWKQSQHFSQWFIYTQNQNYNSIFGLNSSQEDASLTMLGALGRGGGGKNALGRHAAAALLNAANPNVNYTYTTAQIISMVQNAFATNNFENAKNLLATENEKGADLSSGGSSGGTALPGFGDDADSAPGPTFIVGATAIFTFVVTNPGPIAVGNVIVIDDNETPGNTADDFQPSAVIFSGYNVGDDNQDNLLDPGEIWLYTSTRIITSGFHTNNAVVTANPVDAGGTPGGPTLTDQDPANYNAGELRFSSITGLVYCDANNDGNRQSSEYGLSNVRITLTGTDDLGNAVLLTANTNNAGVYTFTNLRPGTYRLTETQPSGAADGLDRVGTAGGTLGNDVISNIALAAGVDATGYLFGEICLGNISGNKYLDITGNGLSADDTGLAGVKIYIDANNNNRLDSGERNVTTGVGGSFVFSDLLPGTYIIREVVGADYIRTHPILQDFYSVTLTAGQGVNNIVFANAERGCECYVSNIFYTVNGNEIYNDLRGNTDQGDEVKVTFTIASNAPSNLRFTLVSYTAPESYFNANTASQQRIFEVATGEFGPGTHTLTVHNPDSYFQIDFVCGHAIDVLGPAGSNIFYSPQGRLISADNDGTTAPLANPGRITGQVFHDRDDDGNLDGNESGIAGVLVTLTGTTSSGSSVNITKSTDSRGLYSFGNLRPGTYAVTESQPLTLLDGKDKVGSAGGTLSNDRVSGISLAAGVTATGYTFAEKAVSGTALAQCDTGKITFWNSTNGKNLIRSFNGSSSAKNLGNWLATNFPSLYGSSSGNTTANKTNSEVYDIFRTKYNVSSSTKLEAQIMAAALSVYASSSTLAGGNYADNYGFNVSSSGIGGRIFSVGSNGSAFGVSNNSNLTIMQYITIANANTTNGMAWNGMSSARTTANSAFVAIANRGGIS